MQIVYGIAGLTLTVLLYAVVLIGCRNPRQPVWINDFLVGCIYVPIIGGLLVLGVGSFLRYFLSSDHPPISMMEVVLAVGIAALGMMVLKALRVKKHLADYAAAIPTADVIHLADVKGGQPSNHPPSVPTPRPTSGKHAA
jgi:hypothetical protein